MFGMQIVVEEEKQTPEKMSSVVKQAYDAMLDFQPEATNFWWSHKEVEQLNNPDTVGLGVKGPGTIYYLHADEPS